MFALMRRIMMGERLQFLRNRKSHHSNMTAFSKREENYIKIRVYTLSKLSEGGRNYS